MIAVFPRPLALAGRELSGGTRKPDAGVPDGDGLRECAPARLPPQLGFEGTLL
jgi:hypothetical protein